MFRENEKRKEIEEDQCERQRILHDVSSFKEAESRRNQGNFLICLFFFKRAARKYMGNIFLEEINPGVENKDSNLP